MLTADQILNSLNHIIDPDLKKDIVSLGFVKNIQIHEGCVSFDIELTTPACPIKEEFRLKAEEAVKKLSGVKRVQIQMTAMKNQRNENPMLDISVLNDVGAVIAVSSCKGGVGKSTLSAHLALELASRGYKVGLIDADIYGPSLPTLFNLRSVGTNASTIQVKTNAQNQLIPIEQNGLKLMSFGFLLGENPAIMRGPIVTRYIQQILLNTVWGQLDYLFIDMPPGTGDVHLTITQTIRLSGAIIVTTPHTLSLIDVARGILMFEKVKVPILGVIENMSYFQAESSEKKHFLFGSQGGKALKDRFGVDILAEIPVLPQLSLPLSQRIANTYIMDAVDQSMRALGKRNREQLVIPNIYSDEKNITLKWPDGRHEIVSNFDLRLNSQDALSVNEITGEKILKPEDIRKDITPKKITPLGNYALGIEWNDGHSSGIYTYELISKLAKQNSPVH